MARTVRVVDSPETGPLIQAPIRSHPPASECPRRPPEPGGQIPAKDTKSREYRVTPGSGNQHQYIISGEYGDVGAGRGARSHPRCLGREVSHSPRGPLPPTSARLSASAPTFLPQAGGQMASGGPAIRRLGLLRPGRRDLLCRSRRRYGGLRCCRRRAQHKRACPTSRSWRR